MNVFNIVKGFQIEALASVEWKQNEPQKMSNRMLYFATVYNICSRSSMIEHMFLELGTFFYGTQNKCAYWDQYSKRLCGFLRYICVATSMMVELSELSDGLCLLSSRMFLLYFLFLLICLKGIMSHKDLVYGIKALACVAMRPSTTSKDVVKPGCPIGMILNVVDRKWRRLVGLLLWACS